MRLFFQLNTVEYGAFQGVLSFSAIRSCFSFWYSSRPSSRQSLAAKKKIAAASSAGLTAHTIATPITNATPDTTNDCVLPFISDILTPSPS